MSLSQEAKSKQIQALAVAPVVSADSTSQESILARQARELQIQSATDSKYDTVLERFQGQPSSLLVGLAVAGSLLLVSLVYQRRYH